MNETIFASQLVQYFSFKERREGTSAKYLDSNLHIFIWTGFSFLFIFIYIYAEYVVLNTLSVVYCIMCEESSEFISHSSSPIPISRKLQEVKPFLFFFKQYFHFAYFLAIVNLQLGKSKHRGVFCAGEGRRRESNEKP